MKGHQLGVRACLHRRHTVATCPCLPAHQCVLPLPILQEPDAWACVLRHRDSHIRSNTTAALSVTLLAASLVSHLPRAAGPATAALANQLTAGERLIDAAAQLAAEVAAQMQLNECGQEECTGPTLSVGSSPRTSSSDLERLLCSGATGVERLSALLSALPLGLFAQSVTALLADFSARSTLVLVKARRPAVNVVWPVSGSCTSCWGAGAAVLRHLELGLACRRLRCSPLHMCARTLPITLTLACCCSMRALLSSGRHSCTSACPGRPAPCCAAQTLRRSSPRPTARPCSCFAARRQPGGRLLQATLRWSTSRQVGLLCDAPFLCCMRMQELLVRQVRGTKASGRWPPKREKGFLGHAWDAPI